MWARPRTGDLGGEQLEDRPHVDRCRLEQDVGHRRARELLGKRQLSPRARGGPA